MYLAMYFQFKAILCNMEDAIVLSESESDCGGDDEFIAVEGSPLRVLSCPKYRYNYFEY